jgi:general secretion pathway protein G
MNVKEFSCGAPRANNARGFSLLELLVVLAIIGGIVALASQTVFGQKDTADARTAEIQTKTLAGAVQQLRLDIGRYPTKEEGMQLLVKPPAADSPIKNRWRGPYADAESLNDPWGTPYQYSVPGADNKPFALYSFGSDKKAGGDGVAGEIGILPPAK